MKDISLILIVIILASCSVTNEKKQTQEVKDSAPISPSKSITTEPKTVVAENPEPDGPEINIEDLTGTVWIHRPYAEVPNCVDTLRFTTDSEGYEYRCEFELANNIDYYYANDTLEVHIYGLVSEVHDLGIEIKYGYQLVRTNNRLKLTGVIDAVNKSITAVNIDLRFELLLPKDENL